VLVDGALNIYTDGSSYSSPRSGGMGLLFVLVDEAGEERTMVVPLQGHRGATNNQMELKACVLALAEARRLGLADGLDRIVIHTDSMYVCDNYRKAMFEWSSHGWRRRTGAPVLNADLWKALLREIRSSARRVDIRWVKGHSKDRHNRAVDKAAKKSAKAPLLPPINPVSVRRKLTSESVELGSVAMLGQRVSIRVISCEYLRVQQVWKLKYEVVSKASPNIGKVDLIYSDTPMSDGHRTYVQMNKEGGNPRIVKVFRELAKQSVRRRY
jgi:ribonuclease HI